MQDVNPRAISSLPVLINGMPRSQTPFPPPTNFCSKEMYQWVCYAKQHYSGPQTFLAARPEGSVVQNIIFTYLGTSLICISLATGGK